MQEVESCFALRAGEGDSLEYSAAIFYPGGFSCEFSGRAQMVDFGHYLESFEGDAEGCVLELMIEDDVIQIGDGSGLCQRAFCGARAYLDGTTFARSSREPGGAFPCEGF